MHLTDYILQNLIDQQFEKIRETEDYQAAWEQKNAAEKELIEALTRKQRRLFHECIQRKDELLAVELEHLLENCTLIFSVTPRSQNPRTETVLPRDGASPLP